MQNAITWSRRPNVHSEDGYSLIEMLIAIGILMTVSAGVFTGVQQLTTMGETINNRAEMHAGVRNATELLQQEIGQAGRIALPGTYTLVGGVVANPVVAQTVTLDSTAPSPTAGMFVGQNLKVDISINEETVTITALNPLAGTITAVFTVNHAAGAPVGVQGGFASGVVPTNMLNGSTGNVLKIYGDVNSDGNMVYIEYSCDTTNADPTLRNLYRNAMAWNAALKQPPNVSQVLLTNLQPNPGGTPCFTYQERTFSGTTYVVDVAITLTVQTERRDPVTGLFQLESKALLNVSPRNVFQVAQMAAMNVTDYVQPMPPAVAGLLFTAQVEY